MTQENQKLIAEEILDGLKATVSELLPKLPEEWNGIQIRQWISDLVRERHVYHVMAPKAKRAYRNEVLTRNLT